MSARIDHAATAIRALGQIRGVDEATNQITVALEAQVHAQLALVEQQRIANLIALGQFRIGPNEAPVFRHLVSEPRGDIDIAPVADIREALGLA